jgi:two-component system OmpR family response regulator
VPAVIDPGSPQKSAPPLGTILVIDDDRDIRSALAELLEGEGYSVIGAADGLAAVETLRRGLRPDVIVLDVMMTGMDGWDFRAYQLREPALRLIPTLVISAAGFSPESIKAQFATNEYVPKPLAPDFFLAKIRHLTRGMDSKPTKYSTTVVRRN